MSNLESQSPLADEKSAASHDLEKTRDINENKLSMGEDENTFQDPEVNRDVNPIDQPTGDIVASDNKQEGDISEISQNDNGKTEPVSILFDKGGSFEPELGENVSNEPEVVITNDKESQNLFSQPSHGESKGEEALLSNAIETGDLEQEEPNTSILNVPSQSLQFTTPLKSLPPLKDIDNISTPKSFDVAKDAENIAEVDSSPIFSRANLKDDENTEDKLEVVASFLKVEPKALHYLKNEKLLETLHKKSIEFEEVRSENSLMKLNQEQMVQIQLKKFKILQRKLDKLDNLNTSLSNSNQLLLEEKSSNEKNTLALLEENNTLKTKVSEAEERSNKCDKDYDSILFSREQEILKLNDSVNQLGLVNIEQSKKLNELNKEINELRNEKFSIKLQFTRSENEAGYLKEQKKWYEEELASLQARFTELVKKNEAEYITTTNKISSLSSKNETLLNINEDHENKIRELTKRVEKGVSELSSLRSNFEIEKGKFNKELKSKDELLELTKLQSEQRANRILQLDSYIEDMKLSLSNSIQKLQSEVDEKTENINLLEEKLKRTEDALDQELHKETQLPKLSETSELIASQGISLSSLYTEFNHLKKQLVLERSQKERLADQLGSFVNELESKKPIISNYKEQIQFYERSLKEMVGKVETVRTEKLIVEKESNKLNSKIFEYENELSSMKTLCKDLGKQLCYYLIHSKIREDHEDPLTLSERKAIESILEKSGNYNDKEESETDQLITNRLILFSSITEMQKKNQELIMLVRKMSKELEAKELEGDSLESSAIEEAKGAILTLEGELESMRIRLDAVTKERDILKSLPSETPTSNAQYENKYLSDTITDLNSKLNDKESILKDLQYHSNQTIKELNEKLHELSTSKNEMALKLSQMTYKSDIAENRCSDLVKSLESTKKEIDFIKKDVEFWKTQSSKQEDILIKKSNDLRDCESSLANKVLALKNLESEMYSKNSLYETLKEEVIQLRSDKSKLNEFVSNLQTLLKDREESAKELSQRLNKSIENYQSLQDRIYDREEKISILSNQSELALKAQNTKLEQVNELSQKLLDSRNLLVEKEAEIDLLKTKIKDLSHQMRQPMSTNIQYDGNENGSIAIEFEKLKEELKIAESQVQEYSSLAEAAESTLLNTTSTFDKYKQQAEQKYSDLVREKNSLEESLEKLKQTLQDQKDEIESINKKNQEGVNELLAKLDAAMMKANSYDEMENDYKSKLKSVKDDLDRQVKLTVENQDKYHEELKKNEDYFKSISSLKEEIEILRENLQNLSQELSATKSALDSKDDKLLEEKSDVEERLRIANLKIKDLQDQNTIILNQLELLKLPVNSINSDQVDDLRNVVSYLRREKDSAESRASVMHEEYERLKQTLDQKVSELNVLKAELRKAEANNLNVNNVSNEHERLLEQLQQLNILRESNTMLRNENTKSIATIEHLNTEVNSLRIELDPLRKQIKELQSEMEMKEQTISLVQEENRRLKGRNFSSNPELEKELENMKQKYNSIRDKANTRIQSQNEKIKQLQSSITSLKAELEATSKNVTASDNSKEISDSNDKLESLKVESNKVIDALTKEKLSLEKEIEELKNKVASMESSDSRKTYESEINNLRDEFSKEKEKLQVELDTKLNEEKKKMTSNLTTQLRLQIEKEFAQKYENLEKSLEDKKAEVDSDYQKKLEEFKKGFKTNVDGDDKKLQTLIEEYEAKLMEKEKEFEERLKLEKSDAEKQIAKKYELKLKLLNKKLEKKDNKPSNSEISGSVAESNIPNSLLINNPQQHVSLTQGHPFTESTLTVHRPTDDTAPSNEKKRVINSNNQSNKRAKE